MTGGEGIVDRIDGRSDPGQKELSEVSTVGNRLENAKDLEQLRQRA